jgi:hypothetical protein
MLCAFAASCAKAWAVITAAAAPHTNARIIP